MKKIALAAASALLPLSVQAADLNNDYSFIQDSAPPPPSVIGHLELSLGWEELSASEGPFSTKEDVGRFEGWGRANIPFMGNWNLEIETGGGALFNDGNSLSNIGAFGHVWGGWNGFRAGVFGGASFFSFPGEFLGSSELGTVGLEAEVDVGNVTLGAQGSYNGLFDCSGTCPEFWNARVWADLYIAANTRLGIEGSYWSVEDVPADASDIWGIAGTAEHRFAGTPVSVFVRGEYENALDDLLETVIVSGGLRVLFDGGMTLEDHDRQVPFNVRYPRILDAPIIQEFGGGNDEK